MKKLLILASLLLLSACATTRNYHSVTDSRVFVNEAKEPALNAVAMALIDAGFELKSKDLDLGVVTTEWVLLGQNSPSINSVISTPGYDWFLQLRARVEQTPQGLRVEIAPFGKQVNKFTPNSFTTLPILFDPKVNLVQPPVLQRVHQTAMAKYTQVISLLEARLKLSPDSFRHSLTPVKIGGL